MSFQAEQKLRMLQKNTRTRGDASGDAGTARFAGDDTEGRSENWPNSDLETILGRINSVMTDPKGAPHSFTSEDGAGTAGSGIHGSGGEYGSAFNQHASELNERPYQTAGRKDEWSVEETQAPEGFVPSEPTDMLQPYSEVLNEVRDYFNDRHSLDPSQRLMDEQNRGSITDDMQRFTSQDEFGAVGAGSQNQPGGQGLNKEEPVPLKLWDKEPYDARPKEISEFKPAKPVDSIFTPIKFDNPFTRDHASVELFTPDNNDLKQLRFELVDRISQLEQVLGHHFGDREDVANEAAQSAVQMMLKNLDDSALGQRLADIETAFVLFQKTQDEKNKNTTQTLQKLGAALAKIAPDMKVSELLGGSTSAQLQKLAGNHAEVTEVVETRQEAGMAAGEAQSQDLHTSEKSVLDQNYLNAEKDAQGAGSQDADLQVSGNLSTGQNEGLADGDDGSGEGQPAEDHDKESSHASGLPESMSAFDPSRSGKAMQRPEEGGQPPAVPQVLAHSMSPVADSQIESNEQGRDAQTQTEQTALSPTAQDLAEDDELGTIDQLRKVLSEGQQDRSFGKQEHIDMAHEAGEDIYKDDFLGKTAALRNQFNQSQIVSNDEDLYKIGQRKSRLPVVIVVVALSLAAMAIVFKNNSKDLQAIFNNLYGYVQGAISGTATKPQKASEILKDDGTVKTSLIQEKNEDGVEEDPSTTGNIGSKRLAGRKKINPRLSDPQKDAGISPELLLPQVNGVLGLPPALIGPYSLRHAAANGDASAQYEVARRFSLGQGVPKDHDMAVKWYMHGAAQGYAPSQYRLATYFERGLSVEKNIERARIWYKRSAELGNLKAMHNLAVVSTTLNQKRSDYKEAIYWFKQAASRNLADSQFNLAILYQNGVGLEKNNVEAYKWFSLAARQGDLDASIRRDALEKQLTKVELLAASRQLQGWKPVAVDTKANSNGLISSHMTSTLSHANETIERSRVLTAQILLRKLGYRLEEVDGLLNDQTIAAIKKFEKAKGMSITGKVTPELVQKLNKAAI